MHSFDKRFDDRPNAFPDFCDKDVLQKSPIRLAACLRMILSNEPLLAETKIRLQNALHVATLLDREVRVDPVHAPINRRTRQFLAELSELVPDLLSAERRIRNGRR